MKIIWCPWNGVRVRVSYAPHCYEPPPSFWRTLYRLCQVGIAFCPYVLILYRNGNMPRGRLGVSVPHVHRSILVENLLNNMLYLPDIALLHQFAILCRIWFWNLFLFSHPCLGPRDEPNFRGVHFTDHLFYCDHTVPDMTGVDVTFISKTCVAFTIKEMGTRVPFSLVGNVVPT